ncbi:MAG: leucine-rich repeat domain-containing protein [Sphingobacteriales bacterium]|nr:leucine-rich repeat domain-containing protein [Sphingobacteriales bacterium]
MAICYTHFATAQIVNIPDLNFKNALLNHNPVIDTNNDDEIQVAEAEAVDSLFLVYESISDLTGIENFINLQTLNCGNNQLTSLEVSNLINLQHLDCGDNQLTSLEVADLTNLQTLYCHSNQLSSLEVSNLVNLQTLNCGGNQLTSIEVSALSNLQGLWCYSNQLSSLDVSALSNLQSLYCAGNQLTSLEVSNLVNLQTLVCYFNQLSSLYVSNLPNLQYLSCNDNQLSSLEVSNLPNLQYLDCSYNDLNSLDVSALSNLQSLYCGGNQLSSLLIKNGNDEGGLYFYDNPNLAYICCDESQLEIVKNYAIQAGLNNCQINTYCSFEPGGNYNTISGNVIFDDENNGCDENDAPLSYQIVQVEDGAEGGYTVSDNSGNYELYCNEGMYTLQPVFENPYFSASSATFNFAEDDNISVTQNFCIAPNGTHHDLEITLIPLNDARPGFDANYQITYKNKGNQSESGSIHLQFDDSVLDFVSASPAVVAQSDSLLTWNFADLQPFESRSINLTLNLNSPQETPPLNGGDTLKFLAYSDYPQTDETPNDNNSTLNQTVVDSYDPNDKTCLQGSQIKVKNIDDYLHYVIRFQNTGSAEAIQVVVKDELAENLDISTFQMVAASHDYRLRLENRTLEVFFENINLPDSTTNEPESHGFVAFKIKAADSVTIGSQLKNTAEIYFDYNFPIITNTTETAVIENQPEIIGFEAINAPDLFQISPNPASDFITLNSSEKIESVEIYDAAGRLRLAQKGIGHQIDVRNLASGSYFVKAHTSRQTYYSHFIINR